MDLTDKAREIFRHDRYATQATGIIVDHVDDQEVICSMTIEERHCNARDVVMGGALFTLADFTAAVAANMDRRCPVGTEEETTLHWVSLNATIHYLSPAPLGTTLRASCKPLKLGRSTALFQTTIESPDNGKRIAIVETTMIHV